MQKLTEHTGASYEGQARAYAARVDTQPWNAYYDRPAVISLLPPLANAKVLDAGCGSGWYCEYLLSQGATVTAVDFNADFVEMTNARVGQRARVLQADLAAPLQFANDSDFDLVVCPLVMHYLKDWQPTLREFHRVLKPNGVLVFSTHHPSMNWQYYKLKNYFAHQLVEDEWFCGKVRFYHRPLTAMSHDLEATGFVIERLLEPQPTEDFRRVNPKEHDRLTKNPLFLFIRARKV
jgi:SAM-dependent methyltransferase